MMGRKLMEALFVLPVAVLAACGGDVAGTEQAMELGENTQGVLYAPPAPASGNILDSTTHLGSVNLGSAVQTSFTTNPQYYSFKVQVPASSLVSLEVTHLGSSMYLDTGLFVYGPKNASGSYGTTVLAQDDDAGYGQLSKLASVPLTQPGEYLVVVSAGSGSGKQFRLQTGCVGGGCSTLAPAPAGYQLTLTEQAITSQLQSTLATGEAAYHYTSGSLRRFDFAWPYSGEPTLAQADAAVFGFQEYQEYGYDAGTALTYAQLYGYLYSEFQPLHAQILSTYGNGVENVQVMTHYYTRLVAPGASGWFRLNVILFPQSRKVIVFEQTAYET
ncbi:hypothetical protein [Archangium lansingense]|uniref:Lipoprotein n=1 Tax=Archangium lansingense TaxID=2995310 RepID=A0ABT4APQ6_9BACT|nr:hypothetical protein [Archangium lansinium]MCY1083685.1 hypothetical protein [Archangium lansinium]